MSEIQPPKDDKKSTDSFGNKVEKSPWGVFAMLQIPLVILMAVLIYFMYQAQKGD